MLKSEGAWRGNPRPSCPPRGPLHLSRVAGRLAGSDQEPLKLVLESKATPGERSSEPGGPRPNFYPQLRPIRASGPFPKGLCFLVGRWASVPVLEGRQEDCESLGRAADPPSTATTARWPWQPGPADNRQGAPGHAGLDSASSPLNAAWDSSSASVSLSVDP